MNTSTTYALGIDCGGTSSRWAMIDSSQSEVASGSLDAISGNNIRNEQPLPDNWAALIKNLLRAIPRMPHAIVLGSTGMHKGSGAIDRLKRSLTEAFKLPANAVHVVSDMPIAYLSVLAPGEGILIYAGTGALTYALHSDMSDRQVGGYGEFIDDAGGGYWIGQQGLRHALRYDGAAKSSVLKDTVYDQLDANSWPQVWDKLYSSPQPRGFIANITRAVHQAAEAGDPHAINIIERAGVELAIQAKLLLESEPVTTIGLLGGALNIERLRNSLINELPPHFNYVDKKMRPDEAAARWALTLAN